MFKVGDKVLIDIRSRVMCEDGMKVTNNMTGYDNKMATITDFITNEIGKNRYRLDIDNGRWWWNDEVLSVLALNKGKGGK